jgi:hypothetical protein
MVPSKCPQRHSPSHVGLDPVWAMAREAGIPILFHVGGEEKLDPAYKINGLPPVPDFHGGDDNFTSVSYMPIPNAAAKKPNSQCASCSAPNATARRTAQDAIKFAFKCEHNDAEAPTLTAHRHRSSRAGCRRTRRGTSATRSRSHRPARPDDWERAISLAWRLRDAGITAPWNKQETCNWIGYLQGIQFTRVEICK